MSDEKDEIRRRVLAARMTASQQQRFTDSFAIAERFLTPPIPIPKTVGLYFPLLRKGEVDARMLHSFLRAEFGDRIRTAYPRTEGDRCNYYLVGGFHQIKPGKWGVGEPEAGCESAVPDVVVIPGIAFDRFGNRIGFGHGFFDRTIKCLKPRPIVVGLAYDLQVVGPIQRDLWDEPIDFLVTQTETINMKESN